MESPAKVFCRGLIEPIPDEMPFDHTAFAETRQPIRMGLVGDRQMGKDIAAQIVQMKGMSYDIVVDLTTEIAWDAYLQSGYTGEIVEAYAPAQAWDVIFSCRWGSPQLQ